jgi:hypothetical protein
MKATDQVSQDRVMALGCPWVEFLWSEVLRQLRTLRGMGFNKQTPLMYRPLKSEIGFRDFGSKLPQNSERV